MALLKPVSADDDQPEHHKRRRLKNVPVLPTLLTLGNLLCGFSAVCFCLRTAFGVGRNIDPFAIPKMHSDHIERLLPSFLAIAGWCIVLGMVFDVFDGFVARLSRKASQFGVQLDSLADVVTFGVAPAILAITLLIQASHAQRSSAASLGTIAAPVAMTDAPQTDDAVVSPLTEDRIGRGRWLLIAVYAACAAIRLARFNVETGTEESAHRGFKGLPSPAAAGVVASLVLLREYIAFSHVKFGPTPITPVGDAIVFALPFVTFVAALLMVSRFDYRHMVNAYLRGRRPVGHVMAAMAVLAVFIFHPEITMATAFCLYALTGPIRRLTQLWRKPAPMPEGAAAGPAPGTARTEKTA